MTKPSYPTSRVLIVVALAMLACGPAVDVDDAGDSEGSDPGERPEQQGAMYSACSTVDMCSPLEFCVFPTREGGYCSAACAGPEDPSTCAAAPGDGADLSCFDIGVPDGRWVCALDCADGACPVGMRCEGVNTPSGERSICF